MYDFVIVVAILKAYWQRPHNDQLLLNTSAIASAYIKDVESGLISAHDLKHFHAKHLASVDALKHGVKRSGFVLREQELAAEAYLKSRQSAPKVSRQDESDLSPDQESDQVDTNIIAMTSPARSEGSELSCYFYEDPKTAIGKCRPDKQKDGKRFKWIKEELGEQEDDFTRIMVVLLMSS